MKIINKIFNMKLSSILILIGFLFFIIGILYQIPDRLIPYNYEEYVGGDAYNLIIEASIRGGEIAGAMVLKAIYTVFGTSLLIIGFEKRKQEADVASAVIQESQTTEQQ